ncbi:virion structural protein [Pseudomonas phage PhiPA3]|uniref:Virion structural protein n=1 Tax=Pseudomonas phage PhiPA3 TaxID=998086 RepID=F8SJQ1_BPPA3|nr:virion structural protein [Pseudomonas phage PhiPA3]AEH03446.1 virion structural protein [Pseudomonas phage PhiPA3]
MGCCKDRPAPDTNVPFDQMGSSCGVYAHLHDMFVYFKDERAGAIPCDTSRYAVEWIGIDASTYGYIVTDKLTGETLEYQVVKEFTKEGPQEAFERDWRDRELRYNRGINRALEDHLEALQDNSPDKDYKLVRDSEGYKIIRALDDKLGVVLFRVDYRHELLDGPVPLFTEIPEFPEIPGEVGRSFDRLVKRFNKLGVFFDPPVIEEVKDYHKVSMSGKAYRNSTTKNIVTITYQELLMSDDDLRRYHAYYSI